MKVWGWWPFYFKLSLRDKIPTKTWIWHAQDVTYDKLLKLHLLHNQYKLLDYQRTMMLQPRDVTWKCPPTGPYLPQVWCRWVKQVTKALLWWLNWGHTAYWVLKAHPPSRSYMFQLFVMWQFLKIEVTKLCSFFFRTFFVIILDLREADLLVQYIGTINKCYRWLCKLPCWRRNRGYHLWWKIW